MGHIRHVDHETILGYGRKYRATPKGKRTARNIVLKKKYGITIDTYELILANQQSLCPVCEKPINGNDCLHVDHCHDTGVIRGIVHLKCNLLLGACQDKIYILENAERYLQKHAME